MKFNFTVFLIILISLVTTSCSQPDPDEKRRNSQTQDYITRLSAHQKACVIDLDTNSGLNITADPDFKKKVNVGIAYGTAYITILRRSEVSDKIKEQFQNGYYTCMKSYNDNSEKKSS